MASNKKNKEINNTNLVTIKPITDNQKLVFESWKKGKNQFLFGAAGTGKTFISLFLALREVLDLKKPYDKVVLVRSLFQPEKLDFSQAMRKTKLPCIRCHIKTWCNSCLKCRMNNNSIIYMIN